MKQLSSSHNLSRRALFAYGRSVTIVPPCRSLSTYPAVGQSQWMPLEPMDLRVGGQKRTHQYPAMGESQWVPLEQRDLLVGGRKRTPRYSAVGQSQLVRLEQRDLLVGSPKRTPPCTAVGESQWVQLERRQKTDTSISCSGEPTGVLAMLELVLGLLAGRATTRSMTGLLQRTMEIILTMTNKTTMMKQTATVHESMGMHLTSLLTHEQLFCIAIPHAALRFTQFPVVCRWHHCGCGGCRLHHLLPSSVSI
jgi:hypothetical protein